MNLLKFIFELLPWGISFVLLAAYVDKSKELEKARADFWTIQVKYEILLRKALAVAGEIKKQMGDCGFVHRIFEILKSNRRDDK